MFLVAALRVSLLGIGSAFGTLVVGLMGPFVLGSR
jgi:predicted benzoate:H+ symporter BenE